MALSADGIGVRFGGRVTPERLESHLLKMCHPKTALHAAQKMWLALENICFWCNKPRLIMLQCTFFLIDECFLYTVFGPCCNKPSFSARDRNVLNNIACLVCLFSPFFVSVAESSPAAILERRRGVCLSPHAGPGPLGSEVGVAVRVG